MVAVASAVLAVDSILAGSFKEKGLVPPHLQTDTDRLLDSLARRHLFLVTAGGRYDNWRVARLSDDRMST